MKLTELKRDELSELLAPYLADELVQSMERYAQHGSVTTLDHCLTVVRAAFWLDSHLPGASDKQVLAIAALLHDFYLYDWHGSGWRHSYRHPLYAADNARNRFGVDKRVARAIESHMWPIGITRPPTSREAMLICIADKYCALSETLFHRRKASL